MKMHKKEQDDVEKVKGLNCYLKLC